MRHVRVLVAIALCAWAGGGASADAPASTKQFAAPEPAAEAPRWQVGEWVEYKRRERNGIATEQLRVVARDTCGFWIERWLHGNGVRYSWLFCMRAQPAQDAAPPYHLLQAVIERRDRAVVFFAGYGLSERERTRLSWLVDLVHPPPPGWSEVAREDVATPAGHFAQAAKVTTTQDGVATTRWSHPAVPFGGVVKEVSAGSERVLVDFGTSGGGGAIRDAMADLQLAQQSFREVNDVGASWIGMRVGYDGLGSLADVTQTLGFGASFGVNMTAPFAIAFDANVSGESSSPDDPKLGESMLLVVAGIRWFPLGRTRTTARTGMREHALLYGQADIGYAQLYRRPIDGESTTVGRGVGLGARLGLIAVQGRGWTYGIEIHDHFALLNADEGVRHSFGVQAVVQLFSAPSRYSLPW